MITIPFILRKKSTADSDGSNFFHRGSDGWFGCGFCIYVECGEEYSDAELMKYLGISGYSPLPPEDSPDQPDDHDLFVQIASDGRWTHISDDGYYTLWTDGIFMSGNLPDRIVKLARLHNIFTRVLGEADDSFEFEYFEGSKLRRRYVVEDPYFDKDRCIVAQDYGEALTGEEELSEEVNMDEKIRRIEDALGIETDLGKLSIRTYTKPYREPSFLNRLLGRI